MLRFVLILLYLEASSTLGLVNDINTAGDDSSLISHNGRAASENKFKVAPWPLYKLQSKRSLQDEISNNLSEERKHSREHSHRHQHGNKNHLHDSTTSVYNNVFNEGIDDVTSEYNQVPTNTVIDPVDIEESVKKLETVVAKTIENNNQTLNEELRGLDMFMKGNVDDAESSNQLMNEFEKNKFTAEFDTPSATTIVTPFSTVEPTDPFTSVNSENATIPQKLVSDAVDDYSTIFYSENANLSKSTLDQGLQSVSLVTENTLELDLNADKTSTKQQSAETQSLFPSPTSSLETHNYEDNYDDEYDEDDDDVIRPIVNETSTLASATSEEITTKSTYYNATESTYTTTNNIVSTTTEKVVSTTEVIEIVVDPNSQPQIKSRIQKILATAGKFFQVHIPSETFWDKEDGHNLKLELIDRNGSPLGPSSWIQFDAEKGDIYGLPLEDSVSRWQYKISASDKEGASVTEMFDIIVHQHKGHRSVNHEINLNIYLETEFPNNIDWQIFLMRNIAKVLNDDSISTIVVREIRYNNLDSKSISFIYTNDSLPKDKCPEEQLTELLNALNINKLNHNLDGKITVKMINGDQIGACEKNTRKPKPPEISRNFPPLTRNQVDRLNATVGQLLVFKVPSDTFFDPEDGTDLKIILMNSDRNELDQLHWLQFDTKNQEFFGVPKAGDIGQSQYFLVAADKEGLTVTDALIVCVEHANKRDFSVLFEMTLGIPYETFNSSAIQRRFIERLAALFQDSTTSNILIRSIRHIHHSGYTLVTFYNTTLHRVNNRCPEGEINKIKNILLHQDSSIRDSVKDSIGLEFNIQRINLVPIGTCQGFETYHHEITPPVKADDGELEIYKEDYLLTYIFPTCIILVMLFISFIITCILYKRRQTGKVELGDEEERKSFRSKGIPVIFQDELDEKPDICNKPPIILKNEKPPLLTHYNGMTSEGEHDSLDEYKPPPAVLASGRETRGKSPVTPSYRKPPPYVSP